MTKREKKALMSVIDLLAKRRNEKRLCQAIRTCVENDIYLCDLFAALIAKRVGDNESVDNFIDGPCPSPQWGGTGKGAIVELKTLCGIGEDNKTES